MTENRFDFYEYEKKNCPACNGTGVQYSHIDGLKHRCPMCNGKGKVAK